MSDHSQPTNQQIERIDEIITLVLNEATLKVEGLKHRIPYSKKKAKTIGAIKHWKNKVKQAKGVPIDENENNIYEINHDEEMTLETAIEQLNVAKKEWEEMKKKGNEFREKDLLDSHPNELTAEFLSNEHLKKKAIRNMLKNRQRKSAIRHMTKHIGH